MRQGHFTDKDIKSVDKVITCLKYLNQGRELDLGSAIIKIAETERGGFQLLMKMRTSRSADPIDSEVTWLGYHGDIIGFSNECNALSDDEIAIMQANMVLSANNKG